MSFAVQSSRGYLSKNSCAIQLDISKLADEEIALILQYCDMVERLLFQRVCKQWRFIFTSIKKVQHIRPNKFKIWSVSGSRSGSVFTEFVDQCRLDDYTTIREKSQRKYNPTNIQQIIIDYGINFDHPIAFPHTDTSHQTLTRQLFKGLADRFSPTLTTIRIANYLDLCPWYWSCEDFDFDISEKVEIQFSNGLISVMPRGNHFPEIDRSYFSGPIPYLSSPAEWFVRVSNMTLDRRSVTAVDPRNTRALMNMKAIDDELWPYGHAADVWLANHVAVLHKSPDLIGLLRSMCRKEKWDSDHTRDNDWRIVCRQHKLFCDHLPVSHYQQIQGHYRRFLSLCILQIGGSRVYPIPYNFLEKAAILSTEGRLKAVIFC